MDSKNSPTTHDRDGFFGHPKGLALLFSTELWERFSYYGTQSLLVLFLVTPASAHGFGWEQDDALRLFGFYAGSVWFAPVLGGWIADNLLDARRCVSLGCVVMATGHFLLAGPAVAPIALELLSGLGVDDLYQNGDACLQATQQCHEWQNRLDAVSKGLFFGGLVLIVLGSGLFKGNVSVIMGELYRANDHRRDSGFTIFYMGINCGAMLAPLVAGTLGEVVGWHYGFSVAGLGMLIGLVSYQYLGNKYLGTAGSRSMRPRKRREATRLTEDERRQVRFILVMCLFATVFWSAYMQFGGLINIYAYEYTDRTIDSFTVPATWFLSINPIMIMVLGPAAVAVWNALDRRGKSVGSLKKFALGLVLLGAAFCLLGTAAAEQERHGTSHMGWLVSFHVMLTVAELCVAPIGLAIVSRLAPGRIVGLLMGVWLLTLACGNLVAGQVGALAGRVGLITIFFGTAVSLLCTGIILSILADRFSRGIGASAIAR